MGYMGHIKVSKGVQAFVGFRASSSVFMSRYFGFCIGLACGNHHMGSQDSSKPVRKLPKMLEAVLLGC